jgi:glutamate--cysteine ligase catalytic subunit
MRRLKRFDSYIALSPSRKIARGKMHPHEVPVTLTSFPRLGVKGVFLDPHHEPNGEASQSLFLPDEIINPHVRFP